MTWTTPESRQASSRQTSAKDLVPGTVYLVGAGPGDPDLITLRGLRCLRQADVVLHDALLHPDILQEVPAAAERIFVGKTRGCPGIGQDAIHRLMILHARRGAIVVRLKGGDPFIFGRGAEEAEALAAVGIASEVVPAVSSAFGVPALAGIPLTHRNLAHGFAVVTGHQIRGATDWSALARMDTLVVLMGLAHLAAISQNLQRHGRGQATPIAVISRGTLPDQRVVTGTLANIVDRVAEAALETPAMIVVGDVVTLRPHLTDVLPIVENTPFAPSPDPLPLDSLPLDSLPLEVEEALAHNTESHLSL